MFVVQIDRIRIFCKRLKKVFTSKVRCWFLSKSHGMSQMCTVQQQSQLNKLLQRSQLSKNVGPFSSVKASMTLDCGGYICHGWKFSETALVQTCIWDKHSQVWWAARMDWILESTVEPQLVYVVLPGWMLQYQGGPFSPSCLGRVGLAQT